MVADKRACPIKPSPAHDDDDVATAAVQAAGVVAVVAAIAAAAAAAACLVAIPVTLVVATYMGKRQTKSQFV